MPSWPSRRSIPAPTAWVWITPTRWCTRLPSAWHTARLSLPSLRLERSDEDGRSDNIGEPAGHRRPSHRVAALLSSTHSGAKENVMPPNDLIIVNAKVKTLDQKNLAARMCQERCAAAGLVNAWCDKRSRMRAATIFTSFHFAPSQKHRLVITRCGRAWCVGDDGEATDAATSTAVAASRTTAQMQV